MSKRERNKKLSGIVQLGLGTNNIPSVESGEDNEPSLLGNKRNRLWLFGGIAIVLLLGLGVMAKNGWLPTTDAMTGKRTGWFGSEPGAVATGSKTLSWNPLAPPPPTPQLSKEYIYASGSRLLAVEDANASAAPPADLAVWRPSSGTWYVLGGAGSTQTTFPWGSSGDKPVPGDFDGDGKTDFSVYRPSTGFWYVTRSSDGSNYSVYFGASTDIPAPADYDGDGKTDLALYRPSTYIWYIVQSSNGATIYPQFGSSGDVPAPADYDGDGRSDLGVWRSSNTTFYSVNSSNGQFPSASVGSSGDKPASADFDGDGKADYAVFNTANGNWHIRKSTTSTVTTTPWGATTGGDVPVQNDYDGDGKVDIAIWRSDGQWSISQSGNGQPRSASWGISGDIPVPAYYRR